MQLLLRSFVALVSFNFVGLVCAQVTVPGYCCPQTAKGSSKAPPKAGIDSHGDLDCFYDTPRNEFCTNDGYCSYALRDRDGFGDGKHYKAGTLTDYRCTRCADTISSTRNGNVPCSSNICCPSSVAGFGFGALKEASFNGDKVFWCAYQGGSGCQYNINTGKLTFTYYHGPCPSDAATGETCVIQARPV